MSMTEPDGPLTATEIATVRHHVATIERLFQEFNATWRELIHVMREQARACADDSVARDAVICYLYTRFGYPPIPPRLIALAFDLTEREVVAIVAGTTVVQPPDWLQHMQSEVDFQIDPRT